MGSFHAGGRFRESQVLGCDIAVLPFVRGASFSLTRELPMFAPRSCMSVTLPV
jgi:hypothetical protein